jgi:sulfate/thiosulfate transport system ATP-binding protein
MSIEIRNVSKNFGDFKALRNVSLNIDSGELVALLGPSGCGKTTLLRIIAGLETADAGSILFAGEDTTDVHVRERQVGFVFQHYALFRHMTVFDNVAFGLRMKPRGLRPSDAQIKQKVHDLLGLVQLDWLADRFPSQLSGGQRQRIALARVILKDAPILVLDEATSALDSEVEAAIQEQLAQLMEGRTVIAIAHRLSTICQMDRLCVLDRGRIVEEGTHERLLAEGGTYAALWRRQSGGFRVDRLGDAPGGGEHGGVVLDPIRV